MEWYNINTVKWIMIGATIGGIDVEKWNRIIISFFCATALTFGVAGCSSVPPIARSSSKPHQTAKTNLQSRLESLLPPPTEPEIGNVDIEHRKSGDKSFDSLGTASSIFSAPHKIIYARPIKLSSNITGKCGEIQNLGTSQYTTYIKFQKEHWYIEIYNSLNQDLPIETTNWVINYLNNHNLPSCEPDSGKIIMGFVPEKFQPIGGKPEWGGTIFYKKNGSSYFLAGPMVRTLQKASSLTNKS